MDTFLQLIYASSTAYDWLHYFAQKLLPYAPLITPSVAVIAGCIGLYSIHVTRTIARKRATIDFFLKTEADGSIVKLFQQFEEHLVIVKQKLKEAKKFAEVTNAVEYKTVHACLNMHELIAVGISNKVFDEKVAYNYWSGALVAHCGEAASLIDASRAEDDDLSVYISMLALSKRWKKKIDKWTKRHARQRKRQQLVIVQGPVVPHWGDPEV
jgi:hypothetical protein